jgi:hypothetical protein
MFLNDLDIARNRVVVTDSMNARVGVIPLGEHGALPIRRRRSSCR